MRKFPLAEHMRSIAAEGDGCDPSLLTFNYLLNTSDFRGSDWVKYMEDQHRSQVYYFSNETTTTERRQLGSILPVQEVAGRKQASAVKYSAKIELNCYCNEPSFKFLRSSCKNFCIMHDDCPEEEAGANLVAQIYYLSPMHKNHFFPTAMPPRRFPAPHPPPIRLCSIGGTIRRNLSRLGRVLSQIHPAPTNQTLTVDVLGTGDLPPPFQPPRAAANLVAQHAVPGFRDFYDRHVAACHVILPLVEPSTKPWYFNHSKAKKLTGSVVQGVAYGIDMVMHRDLERIYRDHLTAPVEIYEDDTDESFLAALERVLKRKGFPFHGADK